MAEPIEVPVVDEVRVLVIDDDISAATSTYDLIEVLGCRGAVAFGGRVGRPIANNFKPHLVLVDYEMPLRDGCEVMSDVRSLEGAVARAMFVCVSGHRDSDIEARCLNAGFDRFVTKPMSLSVLKGLIEEARERASSFAGLCDD